MGNWCVVREWIVVVVSLRLVELHCLRGDPLEVFFTGLVQRNNKKRHLVVTFALDGDFDELGDAVVLGDALHVDLVVVEVQVRLDVVKFGLIFIGSDVVGVSLDISDKGVTEQVVNDVLGGIVVLAHHEHLGGGSGSNTPDIAEHFLESSLPFSHVSGMLFGHFLVLLAASSHFGLVFSLIGSTSLSGKSLTFSLSGSGFLRGLSHGSLVSSLISSGLSLHVGNLSIDLGLGGGSGSLSSSLGLGGFSGNTFGFLLGSNGIGLTLESHLMLQFKLSMGSLELPVLFFVGSDLCSESSGFGVVSIDFSLSGGILGVTKSLELSLLFRMLLFFKSSLFSGDAVFFGLSVGFFLSFLPLNLVSNGLETISFSLGSHLSETFGLSLLSLDSSDSLLLSDASIFFLLPGGKTGLFALFGKSSLLIHGLSQTSLDSCFSAAFFTSGTDGLLLSKGFGVLDSLAFSLLGKLLLAIEFCLPECSCGLSGSDLGSSSLILGSGNSGLGISSATSLSSIALFILQNGFGLGSSKLCLEFVLIISLGGFLLQAFKLGLGLLSFGLKGSGSHLLVMSSLILSLGFILSSLVTSFSLSLGTFTFLSSLGLQFLLLLSDFSLRISFQRIKSGLSVGSGLLLSITASLSKISRCLHLLDLEHALEVIVLGLNLSKVFATS